MHSVTVRDDLRALEGYHSPQVDVRVRLNTNEAPTPPPTAWRDAFAAELSRVEWHRYPDRSADRSARGDRRLASRAARSGVRRQRIERGAADAAAGLRRLRVARVVTFEPTYQMHGHIARLTGSTVVEGERGPDFRLDVGAAVGLIHDTRPAVTFLCSPNNPTGLVEPVDERAQRCSPRSPACWWSTRRTDSSPIGPR